MKMKIKDKLSFLVKLSRLFNKKEKIHFFLIMTVVLLMSFFQALGIASIFPFISLIMDSNIIYDNKKLLWLFNFFNFQNERTFIIATGMLMAGIIIIGNLISALAIGLKSRFIWKKTHHLSTELLKKYLSFPYYFFLTQNTSNLGRNVLNEVKLLARSFMLPIMEILIDFTMIFLILITLLIVSPITTIIIIIMFSFFYGVIFQFGLRKNLKKKGSKRIEESAGCFKTVFEALGGIKDIKILRREQFFLEKFKIHSYKYSNILSWQEIAVQMPRYFVEIITFGGGILFILYLLVYNQNIQQIIPVISFFAFAGYKLMPTLNKMFNAFTQLQFNKIVLDKIYSDINSNIETISIFQKEPNLNFENEILFNNISFCYPNTNNYVFKDINIKIKKNTSVAIIGQTGVGKTTLVDILLGLLTPTKGNLQVDNNIIDKKYIRSWQKNLGYVPQYIYLSDDTIKRNIAFGIPDNLIDDNKINKASKIANLHTFIENLEEGYNTIVGERGIRLSGGQRQRIGIARALYNDPSVLVFDEATSSLDGITETAVLKAIDNITKLKTLIIIAHRLTTVKQCDMIYLLDNGKIIATGTYENLFKNNPQFKAMSGVE